MKKLLITGANGFIGKNLLFALQDYKCLLFDKEYSYEYLDTVLKDVDFIFHLASGIKEGYTTDLTEHILCKLDEYGHYPPIVFTSSVLALGDTDHGRYKRREEKLLEYYKGHVYLYRLPNVFGRWARPEYNSAVATFMFNTLYGLPLKINDPIKEVQLVDIEDVVYEFKLLFWGRIDRPSKEYLSVNPVYLSTVGELAEIISTFEDTTYYGDELAGKLYNAYIS